MTSRIRSSVSARASSVVAAPSGSSDPTSVLDLRNVRSALIRQEDTIIFSLIERAQFKLNPIIYEADGIPVPGYHRDGTRHSLLEYMLRETEALHGRVRRYTAPDEHAFYPEMLPTSVLPPVPSGDVLAPCAAAININSQIMGVYLEELLPAIAVAGDDNNHGSSSLCDIACLQALSKRIHYGKFVAEAKFRAQPEKYRALIEQQDADGLMELLTDLAVEDKVLERVRRKAAVFGRDISEEGAPNIDILAPPENAKVQPDTVADLYGKRVMPLTKQVQVAYLLRRLDAAETAE